MAKTYHFSVDDVFDSLMELSDRELTPDGQPFLNFCGELVNEGAAIDLYLFRQARQFNGASRKLDEITAKAANSLRQMSGIRFGPHAEDYATAPYAQTLAAQTTTILGIFAQISRLVKPDQHARWVRLHYFSECFELAPLLRAYGVEVLLTTDKPNFCHRMDAKAAKVMRQRHQTEVNGIQMVRSHLRIESFVHEAADPPRFLDRIDAILNTLGFVTLFTHEKEISDPRVRALSMASIAHLQRIGAISV